MSLFKRLFKSESGGTTVDGKTQDADLDSDDSVRPDSSGATDSDNLIHVRIEPSSEETKAQSLLRARDIEKPVFVIGRRRGLVSHSPDDVDFSIRQVEPYTVSRRHCSIERFEDSVVISDLGGKYGFGVDGKRVGGRSNEVTSMTLKKGEYQLILGPRDSSVCFKLIID
ncbi:MAG: FHA domain-containing protein [Opitutaceae bacterium]